MAQNKNSYFQGTEEPAPKKKKYKSEKAAPVQTRFKELLYKNYDLYETPGVDGKAKQGPGEGLYQNLDKYKSVSDFLKKKRKKKRAQRRQALLSILLKQAIDFPIDDQISDPILGDSGTYSDSVPIGGQLDEYLPLNDFEDKNPTQLDFGRDYTDDEEASKDFDLESLVKKYLTPAEPSLYGLPDGISPKEDLDPSATMSDRNVDYGTTDSGNTLYDNMWI